MGQLCHLLFYCCYTAATPIIHQGQVAIVALGKIQALPRFDAQGQVQARQILSDLTLLLTPALVS